MSPGTNFRGYPADLSDPNKILLGGGVYRDDQGKPWVLPSIKMAEQRLADHDSEHEYLNQLGSGRFTAAAAKVIFGDKSSLLREGRVASCQSLGGTGALYLGAQLLRTFHPSKRVYVST